ncbi:hypothetical protein IE81DRAFT_125349 [Ceraceosorus guamensis]|uniref:Uncharacterized protein n=1 Tax=Ceraceosorus guamensis TaxID=1522189 RepID=A0A316VXX5_9BASI|nr:hypothetical protein IE81DRAFT_125349 [Ceraceosorus guamensis]PWN42507.1 hypothetical protein IE81DRAFT_125349 [Ceraceosorus guamensis]
MEAHAPEHEWRIHTHTQSKGGAATVACIWIQVSAEGYRHSRFPTVSGAEVGRDMQRRPSEPIANGRSPFETSNERVTRRETHGVYSGRRGAHSMVRSKTTLRHFIVILSRSTATPKACLVHSDQCHSNCRSKIYVYDSGCHGCVGRGDVRGKVDLSKL